MKDTARKNRSIMAILLVGAGLFMVAVVPFLVQSTLDPMLQGLMKKVAEDPSYASGPMLMAIFSPLCRALIMVAGVTAILIAYPLWQGEGWTWPVALTCLAVPAIGGMYMMLPFVSFVKDTFPPPMPIILTGLIGYWGILLLKKSERAQRVVDFIVFTLLGVATGGGFVLGFGAMRQLMSRPGKPLFINTKIASLTVGGPLNWICAFFVFAAIPLLAQRKALGWWLALIGAVSAVVGSLPTYFISLSGYYLIGIASGTILTVTLLIPSVKRRLIEELAPAASQVS
ncbi:MAG: hypothetical protein DRI81_14635 [Chloroflexi bacterium]|nr:MAG: hypothetical protein DRI81_14635 [Chloroflexota bacterium]